MSDSLAKAYPKKSIPYGWVLVGVAFAMYTVTSAIQNAFGIFVLPLQETFGWSRATISWAMTIHMVVYGLGMVPTGWAMDRINTRLLFGTAAVLVGIGLVLCSRISQPWQLYLLYGLPLGIGISICGPVLVAIIIRWISKNRGLALGISSAGVGFGMLIGAPLNNWLIATYGWRNTYVILGIVYFFILLGCAYFFKSSRPPAAVSEDTLSAKPGNKPPRIVGSTLKQAVLSRQILFLLLAHGAVLFSLRINTVHIVPQAIDNGISPSVAALAAGVIGGVSIIGKLVMGYVQDHIGAPRSMVICMLIQGASMLVLPFIGGSNALFFMYAIAFGFTYGGDIPQTPAISAGLFGLLAIGTIYGFVSMAGNLIGALGPIAAGYVFDLTGSYTLILLGSVLYLFMATFLVSRLKLKY
ncbi:MAG: MFS transporter [Dehalococcoidales bacterium]|nr:MFS transporter [Dehalococcoidales bacterium]